MKAEIKTYEEKGWPYETMAEQVKGESMTIIEKIFSREAVGFLVPSWFRDTLTLTWEQRSKLLNMYSTDNGLHFAISLPAGRVLMAFDCFLIERERTVVEVREAEEPVYIISPQSAQDWGMVAYQLGRRNLEMMVEQNEVICLRSLDVKRVLETLKVPYALGSRAFRPLLVNFPTADTTH